LAVKVHLLENYSLPQIRLNTAIDKVNSDVADRERYY